MQEYEAIEVAKENEAREAEIEKKREQQRKLPEEVLLIQFFLQQGTYTLDEAEVELKKVDMKSLPSQQRIAVSKYKLEFQKAKKRIQLEMKKQQELEAATKKQAEAEEAAPVTVAATEAPVEVKKVEDSMGLEKGVINIHDSLVEMTQ